MYRYVDDKGYIKQTYGICADMVNQLVQELKHYGVKSGMTTVGSKKRDLVTQNGNKPIDYDFNLIIANANDFDGKKLKATVIEAFNAVLRRNGWGHCQDSTSVLTTKQRVLAEGNKTPFSIDVAIVREDNQGNLYRLMHKKTGCVASDRWYWNQAPNSRELRKKEAYLKSACWHLVREAYLAKKNMYLKRNDYDHPSFICYIEAVHEVYTRVHG